MQRRLIFTAILVALFACRTNGDAPAASKVFSLVADSTAYAPGDTAHLVFHNGSDKQVYVEFMCTTGIEFKGKDGWSEVYREDCSRIRVRPTIVEPNASVVGSYFIPRFERDFERDAEFRFCSIVSYAKSGERATVCSQSVGIHTR